MYSNFVNTHENESHNLEFYEFFIAINFIKVFHFYSHCVNAPDLIFSNDTHIPLSFVRNIDIVSNKGSYAVVHFLSITSFKSSPFGK